MNNKLRDIFIKIMIKLNVHPKNAAHKMVWTHDIRVPSGRKFSIWKMFMFELTLSNQVIYLGEN